MIICDLCPDPVHCATAPLPRCQTPGGLGAYTRLPAVTVLPHTMRQAERVILEAVMTRLESLQRVLDEAAVGTEVMSAELAALQAGLTELLRGLGVTRAAWAERIERIGARHD